MFRFDNVARLAISNRAGVVSLGGDPTVMGRIRKTAACLITGLALAVTAALGTIPADAATGCDVTFTTYQPIKAGSHGAQAKAMECLLHKAGYPTAVNGHFSAADAHELAKFRKSIGLNPPSRGRSACLECTALARHDAAPSGR